MLALAALFFLIRGHLPYALLAMAFIILMTWLLAFPIILPPLVSMLGVIAFAIGVAIYGF